MFVTILVYLLIWYKAANKMDKLVKAGGFRLFIQ